MTESSRRHRWLIRILVAALAVMAAIVSLVLLAHTAPVRRAVLRYAVDTLRQGYGITLAADSLQYNLATRRIALSKVVLAATGEPDNPFLTADRVELTLLPSVLRGQIGVERIAAENAHVTVRTHADGTSNLPSGTGSDDDTEPSIVPIGRIEIPRLAVTYADEASDVLLTLPWIAADVGAESGTIALQMPGRVQHGAVSTGISRINGGAAFTGGTLTLQAFELASEEAEIRLDGTLALVARDPAAAIRFSGAGDLPGLLRWAGSAPPLAGRAAVEGTLDGPLDSPRLSARVQSEAIDYQAFRASAVLVALTATPEQLDVQQLDARIADGRIAGAVNLTFASGDMTSRAQWTGLSLDSLMRGLSPGAAPGLATLATGTATFQGTVSDPVRGAIDVDSRFEPSGRAGLGLTGTAALRSRDGAWELTTRQQASAATLGGTLSGDANSADIAASSVAGTLTLQVTDLPSLLTAVGEAGMADLSSVNLQAGDLDATATLSGRLASPRLDLMASAREVAVRDISDLSLDLTASGTWERAIFDARLRQGSLNEATASGTVRAATRQVEGDLAATLDDVSAVAAGQPLTGRIEVNAHAEGPFDALTARGTAALADGRYQEFDIGRIDATLGWDRQVATIDAAIPTASARLRATVPLGGARIATTDLEVADADLARLSRAAGVESDITGTLAMTAHLEAPLDEPRLAMGNVELQRLTAFAGDVPITLEGSARATYDRGAVGIERLEVDVEGTRLSAGGRYALLEPSPTVASTDALRATLTGDVANVLGLIRSLGIEGVPALAGGGPVSAVARVTGRGRSPVVNADLDLGPAEVAIGDLPAIEDISISAQVADGLARVTSASAVWQRAQLSASGGIPLRLLSEYLPAELLSSTPPAAGPATLDVRVASVTPDVLQPFLAPETLAQLSGDLGVSARLQADALEPARVAGEARVDHLELTVGGLPVTQSNPTRIVVSDGVARVDAWTWLVRDEPMTVQGQVRLADREAALEVDGRVDLRLLTPLLGGADVTLAGVAAPRVTITGRLDNPAVNGVVDIADAELRLRDPNLVATAVNGTLALTPEQARMTDLRGTVNGGALTGALDVAYTPDGLSSGTLSLKIDGMGLDFPTGLRSELDADLVLDLLPGPEGIGGTLEGSVDVVRSEYREPLVVITEILATARRSQLTTAAAPESGAARRLALNVRVTTDDDLLVENNIARLRLGGDIRVVGTAASPGLSGRAAVREGGDLFFGRNRYRIQTGTIDFTNPTAIEPTLNVTATTRAGGEEIELTLTGTPETLKVDLRAPEAPELGQADLASLLLTGRRLEQIPGSEASIVGEQVLGYLSGDVLGAASRVVGLDSIQLGGLDDSLRRDPVALATETETDPAARLTFGKSFGDSVDLTFSQSLRTGAAQTWILDYRPIGPLALRFVSDDENLRAYEFRHDLAIGGAPPRLRAAASRPRVETTVASVSITGDLAGPEERLRRVLSLNPGDRFEFSAWQRDRDALENELHGEGRLEARVSARVTDENEGVALRYEITAGPVTRIEVSGYGLSRRTQDAIRAAWTRSVFDDYLRDEAAAIVRRDLAEDGYLQPRIDVRVSDEGGKTLAVDVDPGTRASAHRVDVDPGAGSVAMEIEQWIASAGISELAWRDPDGFERELLDRLRTLGYIDPQVTLSPPVLENGTAVSRVRLMPGEQRIIGTVTAEGAAGIADSRILDAAALRAGDPYDAVAIDRAREDVLRLIRGEGYASARVTAEAAPQPDSIAMSLILRVDEGPRDVLRDIDVRGNRAINADLITRAVDVRPGQSLPADAWLTARTRLFQTGLFRRVDVTAEPAGDATAAERPMRLLVLVEEWPAFRVRYGLELAEERPDGELEGRNLTPGFSADVTRRTLFGRAIAVGGAFIYRHRERLARTFINAPSLFGKPIESTLTLQRSHEDFADATFVTDRTGVSWEQRVQPARHVRTSYSYTFERNHTFDTEATNDPLNPAFDIVVNIARLNGTAAFDTRDNPLDSRRGWLLSSSLEYAPESLGSDIRFVRYVGQAYRFQSFRGVVFASAARIGLARALAGQVLIASERFYAGGARTVRAVGENALGPRDVFDDPAGGRALLVVNQEVRFPMYRWVGGVGFLDAGNVFDTPGNLTLTDLVGAFGAGLRVTTPFALLRADVAWPWSPVDGRRSARWSFGIGQTF